MGKELVFISHITEEKDLASLLAKLIKESYLGMLDTFVSSDGESIPSGSRWIDSIDNALSNSAIQISLCSPQSIKRPWINFEAGASWIRKIPVIPLCHSGLEKGSLPIPLALLQSANIDDQADLKKVFELLSHVLGTKSCPSIDYSKFIQEYQNFSYHYVFIDKVKSAIYELISSKAELREPLLSGKYRSINITIEDYLFIQIAPKLDLLKNFDLLSYTFNGTMMTQNGIFRKGDIVLTQKYLNEIIPLLGSFF